jgi:uncharacterized phiE125 gp8 family phage protein
MSSIAAANLDRAALPAGLLPIAKSHLRVDGTYDDAFITDILARSIAWFERVTNVSVNPVTWTWAPDQGDFVMGAAVVPVSPVNTFTVKDASAADISAGYLVETMSQHGVGLYSIVGTFVSGMKVTLVSGYASITALDPGITDAVLRYTGHLYENREIMVLGTDTQTPGWLTDVIAGYWMPKV